MKNKKLFAAALTAALAVSMMGTSVMASTPSGTTEFSYTPGTSGPTVPVNPTNPENDPNNWMVSYPRSIVLMDNNEAGENANATAAKDVGQGLNFDVKQRVPGTNGNQVTDKNVGKGITIKPSATGWDSGNDIKLKDKVSPTPNEVTMNLIDEGTGSPTVTYKYLTPNDTMATLTHTNDTTTGYAVLKYGSVDSAIEGNTYTGNVTFKFEKKTI